MAITPQAGYELDPNNPNRVRKIGETTTPDFGAISSANLSQTPTANFQTPTEPPVYPVAGLSADLQMTNPERQAQGGFDALTELNKQLIGESQYQAEQEQAQGVAEKTQAVSDLSSRLKTIQNEALAIPLQLQQDATGRGITEGGLRPIQTAALRNNAIQALSTASLLEASRGNLTTAQNLADRAVSQKFDPIKERIKVATANLELILKSPAYSLAEKNRAQKQLDIQNEKARQITKQAEDEKIVLGWMAEATKNNPQAAFQIQQANGKNPQQALSLLAPYLSDPNAKAKALAELEQTRAQTAYYNAQTFEKLQEANTKYGGKASSETLEIRSTAINLANQLISNPDLPSALGLAQYYPTNIFPGAPANEIKNQIRQLQGILALDKRTLLKGSGAISDFEGRTLDRAASAFITNLSDEASLRQLKQVRGALVTMSGGNALVTVTDSSGNTQDVQANSDQIQKMVNDGLSVTYN